VTILRDLAIRLRLEEAGVLSTLEEANEELNAVAQAAEEVQAEFEEVGDVGAQIGDELAGSFGQVEEAGLSLAESFNKVRTGLGAIGLAGLGFVGVASQAATELEWNLTRLKVLAEEAFPALAEAIAEEERRTRNVLTQGQLFEVLTPLVATLPGQADIIVKAIQRIDDAIIAMGGDARAAEIVWTYVAQAIGSGTAEMLIRASRYMPFPIIRGEEAVRIARQMRREYDALTNAKILFEAISKSERLEQEKLNMILDTTRMRLQGLRGAWGNFLEEFGAGASRVQGQVAGTIAEWLAEINRSGAVKPLGEWLALFSAVTAAFGGPTLLARLLGLLNIGKGTILSMIRALTPWALGIGAVSLVLQDVLTYLRGGKSVIGEIVAQFRPGGEIYEKWIVPLMEKLKPVGDAIDRYLLQPMRDFYEKTTPWLRRIETPTGETEYVSTLPPEGQGRMQQYMEQQTYEAGAAFEAVQEEMAAMRAFDRLTLQWLEEDMARQKAVRGHVGEMQGGQQTEDLSRSVDRNLGAAIDLLGGLADTGEEMLGVLKGQPQITLQETPTTEKPQVNITFEPGAISLTGEAFLSEEDINKLIEQVTTELELQLRAVLNEKARPGVK